MDMKTTRAIELCLTTLSTAILFVLYANTLHEYTQIQHLRTFLLSATCSFLFLTFVDFLSIMTVTACKERRVASWSAITILASWMFLLMSSLFVSLRLWQMDVVIAVLLYVVTAFAFFCDFLTSFRYLKERSYIYRDQRGRRFSCKPTKPTSKIYPTNINQVFSRVLSTKSSCDCPKTPETYRKDVERMDLGVNTDRSVFKYDDTSKNDVPTWKEIPMIAVSERSEEPIGDEPNLNGGEDAKKCCDGLCPSDSERYCICVSQRETNILLSQREGVRRINKVSSA